MVDRVEERWSSVPFDSWYRCRFLCLYACLGWELHLDPLEVERDIRKLQRESHLPAYLQWVIELYSESRTSLEEGRAVLAHLLAESNAGARARLSWAMLCELLPKSKLANTRFNPLLKLLERISERGGRELTVMDRDAVGLGQVSPPQVLPSIEREEAFNDFLSTPGFREAFEEFWRKGFKNRNCRQTRVLVLVAAIVAICSHNHTGYDAVELKHTLQAQCHFSEQTAEDILQIVPGLHHEQLDAVWLALSFATDATGTDLGGFAEFVKHAQSDTSLPPGKREKARAIYEQLSLFL